MNGRGVIEAEVVKGETDEGRHECNYNYLEERASETKKGGDRKGR